MRGTLAAVVLSLLLAILAAPIADAYDEPRLLWPLRAVAVAILGHAALMLVLARLKSVRRDATTRRS
jgi:O-antigen/teichoic acid export membrane protein